MAKKKTAKPKRKAAPKKKSSSGTPAPVDPIQAALARRRAAMIAR